MNKIKACSQTVTSPSQHSLKDDGVARVLGPELQGRVRGLGFGATPLKLSALMHNHNLQTQMQELRDEIKELKALFQMKSKSFEQEDNPRDGSLNGSNNLQNRKCKLLSWFEKADVVAKGEIASTNLSDLVHHVPLGNECWRVWVNEVIDNVSLYRPTRELFLLEDALGSTIEWPIRYIEVDSL
ncbi:uncharacterized protein LOC111401263 isoform X1 [Olea europaea var. sylvestris]|uniref:uncharacterized protein LOC111401263 isoform X1 n=1 Tax=Olea europaea var. sylvestris TaxID=158386 RepID=UPI000C1D1B2C|nr:uncharacterized protein LOC111401263 isoform X1 [Olea europaea var. sylvestris]XP_022884699.1 uncharacterized protein LOC111401263 isoform X1 [Olea europaea var. sylvestris]XP_022884700.1 uncharacterized protein LOC111401263 isoform X1 [Olea europaea var. sylvestris]XP_022884701.1 uncharacterized protein LOC111401263 isoform X1 [Olea europaea var. sylvestris]